MFHVANGNEAYKRSKVQSSFLEAAWRQGHDVVSNECASIRSDGKIAPVDRNIVIL